MAALMRWFHDTLAISYHQMSLGEASSSTSLMSVGFSSSAGKTIPTEAVLKEHDDFYGGWDSSLFEGTSPIATLPHIRTIP